MSDIGKRLQLPVFILGIDGKQHRNILRLDPRLAALAAAQYKAMSKSEREYRFFDRDKPKDKDIVEPEWWSSYKGYAGEEAISVLMRWRWQPVPGQRDPGYDFKEPLRFEGKTLFWRIDGKTHDASNPWREKTVLLRWDGDITALPERMIYVWCAYNAALDVAAPVGWMPSSEINPETEQRAPWGGSLEIDRNRLHKMDELAAATWIKAAS